MSRGISCTLVTDDSGFEAANVARSFIKMLIDLTHLLDYLLQAREETLFI